MGQVGIAAHQGHVQLQDTLPGAVVAHHPSMLPEAPAVEGLGHTAGPGVARDIRTGCEAPAAVVHRARELGRRIDSGEAACDRSTADQAGTDADNRRQPLQKDDRTDRSHMTHMAGQPAAALDPGSYIGPGAGHRGLPSRRGLASGPETTGNLPLFRGRPHRGRSSKRTNHLHRGYVRLPFGHVGLCGSFRS